MTEVPKLVYRPMTEADLAPTLFIRKAAGEWLARSQGREPMAWTPVFPRTMEHILRTDPDGSFVATIDNVPVGYAQGLVRGDIWFLAQLFVQPEVHSLGIGNGLLERAHAYGTSAGARVFSVVSTASPVSQSLYMRYGMYAIGIGYRMTGELEPLRRLPEADATQKRIVDCSGWQDRIADLDRTVFGAERRQDHAWYLAHGYSGGDGGEASFGLNRDGELLGYGYAVEEGGYIAPVAAYEPADQLPIVRMAAEWLLEREVTTGSIWTLSLNQTLLGALLAAGWRVNGWSFLMASERFGQFDRYHPGGGILL